MTMNKTKSKTQTLSLENPGKDRFQLTEIASFDCFRSDLLFVTS